jgi:hypothetical protein
MQPMTLGELFSHPSFLTILVTILAVIANIMIGVSMLPKVGGKRLVKPHRYVYWIVLAAFGFYLVVTHFLVGNSWFSYGVFLYFLTAVPVTRKIHLTLHAVLASVGLVLLVIIAAMTI